MGMRVTLRNLTCCAGLAIGLCGVPGTSLAAEPPTVDFTLSFQPTHKGVTIDVPEADQVKDCKLDSEVSGKGSAWIVTGPYGQIIRRFVDTNGDSFVDQWRYYRNGLEVYRDVDADFNRKVDQSRWLNLGGARYGLDRDEDGTIDEWKVISAEEATLEAVEALASGNLKRLQAVLITTADMNRIGLNKGLQEDLVAAQKDVPGGVAEVTKAKIIDATTRWLRFDSSMLMPNLIPAEDGKSKDDLWVYENVMALCETRGDTKFLYVGEMIRVGDAWKLTQVPRPFDESSSQMIDGGFLLQPPIPTTGNAPSVTMDAKTQQLIEELQRLDSATPDPANGVAMAQYNVKRAELLGKIAEAASTAEEKTQWIQQMIDSIAAAAQSGQYPAGVEHLKRMEDQWSKSNPKADLVAYVVYRRLLAEYSVRVQDPKADNDARQATQQWWLTELEKFASAFPNVPDSSEAALQLGINFEFTGESEKAIVWYERIAAAGKNEQAVQRAQGALRRLKMVGTPLVLSGKDLSGRPLNLASLKGRNVLVIYWTTSCVPCTENLPQIQQLYAENRSRGFEVVGICLDADPAAIKPYLERYKVTWPTIFEPGGLDAAPALSYGIVSLPTMFLVDANGMVVSRGASIEELKELLPKMLK